MERYVKWQDRSYQTSEGLWVPEAVVEVLEGDEGESQTVYLSSAAPEQHGAPPAPVATAAEAKAAAFDMVKQAVWETWRIPEARIEEY